MSSARLRRHEWDQLGEELPLRIYLGEGVPADFVIPPCDHAVFHVIEESFCPLSTAGDRFLVRVGRIPYRDRILIVEYITTRVFMDFYNGWTRQVSCFVESFPSPYPYDIDMIHEEGRSATAATVTTTA